MNESLDSNFKMVFDYIIFAAKEIRAKIKSGELHK